MSDDEARREAALTVATEARARVPGTVAAILLVSVEPNLEDAARALRRSDPYLFSRTDAGAGEGNSREAMPSAAPSFGQAVGDALRRAAWG
jgi:hypothetical protein